MTEFAKSTGTRIAFDSTGAGPDLVFLHAGIADRTMWQPQIDALADRYRCTTIDSRGMGESALGDPPFSRRDDLAAVMGSADPGHRWHRGCRSGARRKPRNSRRYSGCQLCAIGQHRAPAEP